MTNTHFFVLYKFIKTNYNKSIDREHHQEYEKYKKYKNSHNEYYSISLTGNLIVIVVPAPTMLLTLR